MKSGWRAFSGYKTRKRKTIKFEVNQDSATLWYHPTPLQIQLNKFILIRLLYIEDSKKNNYPSNYGKMICL